MSKITELAALIRNLNRVNAGAPDNYRPPSKSNKLKNTRSKKGYA